MPETHNPARHNAKKVLARSAAIGTCGLILAFLGSEHAPNNPLRETAAEAMSPYEYQVPEISTVDRDPIPIRKVESETPLRPATIVAELPRVVNTNECWSGNVDDLHHTAKKSLGNIAVACEIALERPWFSKQQFTCLVDMWDRESGWNPAAKNASGAGGIPQALPESKMKSAGNDWLTNPATQITWGLGYIEDRYSTPCKALSSWHKKGWY